MPLLENIRKCVTRRQGLSRRLTRVLFNVPINESFKSPNVPSQIRDLLVYIAREGVAVTDLFRRPGNPQDMKKIIADLEAGRLVVWPNYNFYTLANIAKRYLLHIQGGVLGTAAEERLLSTLDIADDQARIEAMHSEIMSQPRPVQQLLALLFGIWFRMIYHTEVNAMSVEAVAKSVAGSVFPSCTTSPQKVERASKVMEYLITGFASADLFSRELIEYFTAETKTSISRVEKFKYEFRFPKDVPREKSVRLFMRLLLEEGKKHGFHLIHDAVSKERFEAATLDSIQIPGCRVKSPANFGDSELRTASSGVIEDRVDSSNHHSKILRRYPGSYPQRVSMQHSESKTSGGGALIRTKTSTTSTPTMTRRSIPVINSLDRANSSKSFDDPIQQLSEKRTCVTTTSMRRPAIPQLDISEVEDSYTSSNQNSPLKLLHQNSASRPLVDGDQTKSAISVRPASRQPACFNSVKRRQLERLQKRSDWFLSPPAGLRSVGLIHLEPNSPARGGLTSFPPMDDSNSATLPLSSSGDFSMMPASLTDSDVYATESSQLESSSAAYADEEDDKNVQARDLRSHLCSSDDHQMDDEEIDRLVALDPGRVWSSNNEFPYSSNESTNHVRPTASSSPKQIAGFEERSQSPVRTLTKHKQIMDEKENYPEVETRYYVVERYYGPDPRPPESSRMKDRTETLSQHEEPSINSYLPPIQNRND
ncbi:unnamed protein product [Calicophoron daubneyi]|uniref:Rho-GAP domain-containing protein n=1 Tax=Calicophoron daubneyi TaxID=300641 RepID=A0AAV2TRZ4_CALDB